MYGTETYEKYENKTTALNHLFKRFAQIGRFIQEWSK